MVQFDLYLPMFFRSFRQRALKRGLLQQQVFEFDRFNFFLLFQPSYLTFDPSGMTKLSGLNKIAFFSRKLTFRYGKLQTKDNLQ